MNRPQARVSPSDGVVGLIVNSMVFVLDYIRLLEEMLWLQSWSLLSGAGCNVLSETLKRIRDT